MTINIKKNTSHHYINFVYLENLQDKSIFTNYIKDNKNYNHTLIRGNANLNIMNN